MASENRSGPVRTRRVDPGELKRQAAGGSRGAGAAPQRRSAGVGRGSGEAGKAGAQTARRKPARAAAPEVLHVDGIEVRLQRNAAYEIALEA